VNELSSNKTAKLFKQKAMNAHITSTTAPKLSPRQRAHVAKVKNEVVNNGRTHFFHAVNAWVTAYGPEDWELDELRRQAPGVDPLVLWTYSTLMMTEHNIKAAQQVHEAVEAIMTKQSSHVPTFSLAELREFAVLFMAKMWRGNREELAKEQSNEESQLP
jgi:hypothetical protein